MFWQSHAATSASVDQLLDKEDATLEQLLDEDDVIQECKAQNSKVVDFLTRQEVLSGLVDRLISDPPPGSDLALQYRHPSLACEVVQCAIPAVLDRLAADRPLLDRLCAPLARTAPPNPLSASFLSRTLTLLLAKKTEQLLEYLRCQDLFVDHVLHHLGTSAVMDLLCHLVSGIEEAEPRQATLAWLSERRLAQRLAALVGDSDQPERQANAALVLVTVIASARQLALHQPPDEREANPLLETIETEEFVSSLVDAVLSGSRTEAGLVNAVHVLLPLLDPSCTPGGAGVGLGLPEDTPPPTEPPSVSSAAAALLPRLPSLHQALVSPPPRPDLVTSWGRLSPPLGAARLQLARLTAALLGTGRPALMRRLAELGTVEVLLDLFFHFTLNNFLHSQVEQCVSLILEAAPQETGEEGSDSHPLLEQLFTSSKLIQRILHGMEERDATIEKCDQNRCWRSLRAYGGHLVSMANKVVSAQEAGPNRDRLRRLIDDLPEGVGAAWSGFCDAQLRRINELNRPVSVPDPRHDSSNDSDFRGVVESQKSALLKMFTEGSAGGLPEAFGRADDDFRDLSSGVGPLGAARLLSLAAEVESRPGAAELFEQQCADRLTGGGVSSVGWPGAGSSSDEEEDEDRAEFRLRMDEEDEEDAEGRLRMEVDTSDPWASQPPAAAQLENVWRAAPAADLSAGGRGWANFDAFAAPIGRPASPPLLPAPAAALGVSGDSQSSSGVSPPLPPGSGSPHFPVDFSNVAAFGSPEPAAPMSDSPPRDVPHRPADTADPASDRLAGLHSDSSAGDSTEKTFPTSPASPGMDVSSEDAVPRSARPPSPAAATDSTGPGVAG